MKQIDSILDHSGIEGKLGGKFEIQTKHLICSREFYTDLVDIMNLDYSFVTVWKLPSISNLCLEIHVFLTGVVCTKFPLLLFVFLI